MQYLVLKLTRELGRDVRQLGRRTETTAAARRQALRRDSLVNEGKLYAELQIPNTAGALEIQADLMARNIRIETELDAPKEGKSKGRIGWLMRQMAKAPDEVTITVQADEDVGNVGGCVGAGLVASG